MMNDYPKQTLLDYLTRRDEILIQIDKSLKNLADIMARGPGNITTVNNVELRRQLENAQIVPYAIKSYLMTTAQTDFEVAVEGTNIVAASDGSLDGCFVKFNNKTFDASPLKYFDWDIPFWKLYLTWPAQATKTLYLAIGKQAGAKGSSRLMVGGLASALVPELIYNLLPAGIATEYSSLADWRSGKRVVFHITSTLDEAANIQVIGNISDVTASATNLNGIFNIPVGSVTTAYLSIGLAWDDWHPFVGIAVTCPVAPTLGKLTIYAVQQE